LHYHRFLFKADKTIEITAQKEFICRLGGDELYGKKSYSMFF